MYGNQIYESCNRMLDERNWEKTTYILYHKGQKKLYKKIVGKIWRAIREIYDLEKVMATKRLFGNGYRIKEEWLK